MKQFFVSATINEVTKVSIPGHRVEHVKWVTEIHLAVEDIGKFGGIVYKNIDIYYYHTDFSSIIGYIADVYQECDKK